MKIQHLHDGLLCVDPLCPFNYLPVNGDDVRALESAIAEAWNGAYNNSESAQFDIEGYPEGWRATALYVAYREAALRAWIAETRKCLEAIVRNDRSREYEHHEKRPSDGKTPREASTGTKWLTPREIARGALRALDAADSTQSHAEEG